ncbi:MAG: hypothetical protein XD95_0500 [Microgenomates bacterium 39_7]|nr:MAG: hypothetical protein XD95_0500 [Microgenomates bacterium 39_7]
MLDINQKDQLETAIALIKDIEQGLPLDESTLRQLQKKHAEESGRMPSKADIIALYKKLAGMHGLQPYSEKVVAQLRMKPIRTSSGVAPVTVLTKPYFCPGECIFCPSDVRMPKSYLASEPGAQRAEHNFFDPYLQTYNRLQALSGMGHHVEKVELIVLGGSWSAYPLSYKIWFIKECFRALNEFGKSDDSKRLVGFYQQKIKEISQLKKIALTSDSDVNEQLFKIHQPHGLESEANTYNCIVEELFVQAEKEVGLTDYQSAKWTDLISQQQLNETAKIRCVGLVLETRPDLINEKEVVELRTFGATKIQLGLQSLNDKVLKLNKRGHNVAQSARAMKMLRMAGFKLHVHWMPNLYGSSPEQDKQDYLKLFEDECFKPDEIKIYPCSLIESAPLMRYHQRGEWRPYTHEELLDVLSFCLMNTPQYCRITRVVRDIPSFEIVDGNKKTNFRQIAQQELERLEKSSQDIRAREIRNQQFELDNVFLDVVKYQTENSTEMFLQYVVEVDRVKRILGFLRLSLPKNNSFIEELISCAIIREIHVYGQVVGLGKKSGGKAQHLGLGTKLLEKASELAREAGYKKTAVISAIGTREYYRGRGFEDRELYQVKYL